MGDKLIELLRDLHACYADAEGYAAIVYEAEVWLAEKR